MPDSCIELYTLPHCILLYHTTCHIHVLDSIILLFIALSFWFHEGGRCAREFDASSAVYLLYDGYYTKGGSRSGYQGQLR